VQRSLLASWLFLLFASLPASCGVIDPAASSPPASHSCVLPQVYGTTPQQEILRFVKCTATKDNLLDADVFFRSTLSLPSFSTSNDVAWGIQAGSGGPHPMQDLPDAIRTVLYQRVDSPPANSGGERFARVSMSVHSEVTCVTLGDVTTEFGDSFEPAAPPLQIHPRSAILPFGSLQGASFRSPQFLDGDPSAFVNFAFEFTPCVRRITLYRRLPG